MTFAEEMYIMEEATARRKEKDTRRNKMKAYDYVIVGAGLYGAVFAREAVKKGKRCW